MVWEITTRGRGTNEADDLTLEPPAGSDTTGGLARPGTLRLPLPAKSLIFAPSNYVGENWGPVLGDALPRLDDVEKAARLDRLAAPVADTGQRSTDCSLALDRDQCGGSRSARDPGRPGAPRLDRRR